MPIDTPNSPLIAPMFHNCGLLSLSRVVDNLPASLLFSPSLWTCNSWSFWLAIFGWFVSIALATACPLRESPLCQQICLPYVMSNHLAWPRALSKYEKSLGVLRAKYRRMQHHTLTNSPESPMASQIPSTFLCCCFQGCSQL